MKPEEIIDLQRDGLRAVLEPRLERLARRCAVSWQQACNLDGVLERALASHLPHCHLLYAMDATGQQRSANITPGGRDRSRLGQQLGGRPFLAEVPATGVFALSPVYVCRVTHRSCLTAIHAVRHGGVLLGWVAADFDLLDLPLVRTLPEPDGRWRQIRGDPVIREQVFREIRRPSKIDPSLATVNAILAELMRDRGIFHAKLHYSACRASLWLTDDPFRYRIHMHGEVVDPAMLLAYPPRAYPVEAVVEPPEIAMIWDRFMDLRLADPYLYLRSASLNLVNGLVGLNFSCDGSHYLSTADFLAGRGRWWR
ncbi:MAG: PDC sensor domain-containing protein [Gammaproteobacteria bacterium]|jgi:hypothetical protein|nr:PDC sensor domain-containing protein [Gammaproteobacteria bacterium]